MMYHDPTTAWGGKMFLTPALSSVRLLCLRQNTTQAQVP
jgi:hypothetical protein